MMRRLLSVLAVAAVLLGAACSDSGGSEATATTEASATGTTETATAGAAMTETAVATEGAAAGPPIRIGYSAWPGWFPWAVTEQVGIFDQVGVNVEMVWFEGYLDSINAFAAGQLDGNTQTLNDTIASVAAGSDQVIVLVNDNSTGNDQIIVTADIQTIEDLAGKDIGAEVGVVDHFLLLLGLKSVGLSEADVTVVPLETGAAAAAFATGQMDGVGVFAPFTTQALQREGSHVLFTSADFPGAIPDHLALSRELIESRPEDVQKIITAWFLTLDYIDEHRDEALAIMAEQAGVSVADYETYDAGTTLFSIEDNLKAFEPGDDYTSLQYAAEQINQFLVDSEFIPEQADLSGIFDPSFVIAHAEMQ